MYYWHVAASNLILRKQAAEQRMGPVLPVSPAGYVQAVAVRTREEISNSTRWCGRALAAWYGELRADL